MLRRFMNWLLHQLQKILGAISGQRSNSRPFTSTQDDFDTTDAQESSSAISNPPNSAQPGISFSIQPTESSAQQPSAQQSIAQQSTTSPRDAIQRAVENTGDRVDTHTKIDAASFAVSNSPSEPSTSETALSDFSEPSDWSPSDESAADIQLAEQLPSIHDLLPAVEQEIKANSTHFDEEAFATSDMEIEVPDSVPLSPEPYDVDEPEQPVQALLFSFDITESEPSADTFSADSAEEWDSVEAVDSVEAADSVEEEDVTEPMQLVFSPLESIDDALPEAAATPSPEEAHDDTADQALVEAVAAEAEFAAGAAAEPSENDTNAAPNEAQPLALDSIEEDLPAPVSDVRADAAFDKASLPYPWSIATPKNAASAEDKSALQQEDVKQAPIRTEGDRTAEREIVGSSSSHPAPAQPVQEPDFVTKNGIVKLLFTMKEGNFHGYIEPQDGTSDILFHQKYINEDIFASLERGVEVVVSVQYKGGKAYAKQVELA